MGGGRGVSQKCYALSDLREDRKPRFLVKERGAVLIEGEECESEKPYASIADHLARLETLRRSTVTLRVSSRRPDVVGFFLLPKPN